MKKFLFILVAAATMFGFASCSSNTAQIKLGIAAANADCPEEIGDGLILTKVYEENQSVVYEYSVDEDEQGFYVDEYNDPELKSTMKDAMLEFLNTEDADLQTFINACKEANYSITVRYIGQQSSSKVDITIHSYEL